MKMMLSLLMTILLIFIGCSSKENSENISNGTVVDENTIADGDSLAQILQTWVPEVPVDSVEYIWEPDCFAIVEGLYWYEIKFSTRGEILHEFYINEADACVVQMFDKQNGLQLTLSDVLGLKKYTQLLNLATEMPISIKQLDILYSNQGLHNKSTDSTRFAEYCADKNAQLKIEKSYEEELHLRCISVVDSVVAANDYLRMNGEKLKSYCESVEWGN